MLSSAAVNSMGDMDSFDAAWDWGLWLCSALHAGAVGLPFRAGQCVLEGAGERNCPSFDTVAVSVPNH